MDKLNSMAWVGRETVTQGGVTAQHAAMIHATLGSAAEPAPKNGDALPALWHWCAFPPLADASAIGDDGHVRGSKLLPPVRLPRRMWAGGSLTFHRTPEVGARLEQFSRIRDVSEKDGKAGPMVLVTVDHDIHDDRGLVIQERQDIVYLELPKVFSPPKKVDVPATPCEQIDMPETLLFRYSALTFNAHRIHYDLAYAQDVEKYPGLVVHGPLQASLLMRAATRHKGRPPMFFHFRAVHPAFAGTPCGIAMAEDDEGLSLWTSQNGHQCMTAHATWEETL